MLSGFVSFEPWTVLSRGVFSLTLKTSWKVLHWICVMEASWKTTSSWQMSRDWNWGWHGEMIPGDPHVSDFSLQKTMDFFLFNQNFEQRLDPRWPVTARIIYFLQTHPEESSLSWLCHSSRPSLRNQVPHHLPHTTGRSASDTWGEVHLCWSGGSTLVSEINSCFEFDVFF